jgi:vitamin B12 transporter
MTKKSLSLITATLVLGTHTFAEETLQDITIVSASKSTQSLKSVTANTAVITALDIKERGYISVAQALNSIVGISLTQNGGLGQSTSIMLRGMESKRTLVLIDGLRYNDLTGLNGALFEHMMVDNIAQIEVIKGAQSGVWGADASAGIINIITKKSTSGEHGSMYAEKGSFNTDKYGVNLSKSIGNYSVKIGHNVLKSDGFSAQVPVDGDLDTFEDDGYENRSTTFDLGFKITATNKIDFSHKIIDANGEYDTFANPDGLATSSTKDKFTSVNFNHIDSFNEVNLYAKRSKFDRTYTAPNFSGEVETTPYEGVINEYGFTSKIPYASSDFIVVGAEYKKFKQQDSINKNFNNTGFFVNNTNTFKGFIGGETILTESLRTDSYSEFDNKTTGKIGLKHIHGAIKGLTTSVNYGTAYNVPTLYQLYSVYGSAALSPESTTSWDVTVGYKNLSITYFGTEIEELIDFDMSTFKYNNIIGTSKLSGLEASYQTEIFTDFLLSVNYTHLLEAKDHKGIDLKRRNKDDAKVTLDYYGITDLHLGIEAQYVGSRTDTVFNADYSTSDMETGKYTVVNMTANYDLNKEVTLYGKIVNLTDVVYQTVYGFASSPRAFYAGVRAKF